MKKGKKWIMMLVSLCMMTPYMPAFAKPVFNNYGVPDSEATAGEKTCYEIPFMKDGKAVRCITQPMTKRYMKDGMMVEEKGNINIWVRGYAYSEDGSTEIKIGATLTYLDASTGEYVTDWWDNNTGSYSKGDSKPGEPWKILKDLYIEQKGELKFQDGANEMLGVAVTLGTNKGGSFTRMTGKPIAFGGDAIDPYLLNVVSLAAMDAGKREVDTYTARLNITTPTPNSKIFSDPVRLSPNSTVRAALNLEVSDLSRPAKYQIITRRADESAPTLPYYGGDWKVIKEEKTGVINGVTYSDMINTPNRLTAQHYIYTPGYEKSPKEYGLSTPRNREIVFSSPVNGVIQQSATLGDNTQYSTQSNKPAFFKKSNISNGTVVKGDFVAKETGKYKFCVYSATGSEGSITVDGRKVNFANNFGTYKAMQPKYYGQDVTVNLVKGQSYPIELKTQHRSSDDKAPCFKYSFIPGGDFEEDFYNAATRSYNAIYSEEWKTVTPDLFINQDASNGANRAAKFWGFIIPDKDGKFNFGVSSDDGAYGYLVIDGEKKVFVDSFAISSAKEHTTNAIFDIKAGRPYPFYLEWYEGCPSEQALAPRYRVANEALGDEEGWSDIPGNWFRPSSNKEVATKPLETFTGANATADILLPNNSLENYVLLNVNDRNGKDHQILYGPFTTIAATPAEPPKAIGDNNYIVPTSVSNVSTQVTYASKCKELSYELDLSSVKDYKIASQTTFTGFPLDASKLTVVVKEGKVNPSSRDTDTNKLMNLTTVNPSEYEVKVVGNKVVVAFKNKNQIINKNYGHQIDLYYQVDLGEHITYYTKSTPLQSYFGVVKAAKENEALRPKVTVISKNKPQILEAVIRPDTGAIVTPEQYSSTPVETTEDIELTLREIPGIN